MNHQTKHQTKQEIEHPQKHLQKHPIEHQIEHPIEHQIKLRYNKVRDERGMLLQDREVMGLLLAGKDREEIGKALHMPRGTVNTCCTRIYKIEGVKSLGGLLAKYISKTP